MDASMWKAKEKEKQREKDKDKERQAAICEKVGQGLTNTLQATTIVCGTNYCTLEIGLLDFRFF